MTIVFSLSVLMCLFASQTTLVRANTSTSGGDQTGVPVRETFEFHQGGVMPHATDIHLIFDTAPPTQRYIKGWKLSISKFNQADSDCITGSPLYVDASGAQIEFCTNVTVIAEFYLSFDPRYPSNTIKTWVDWTYEPQLHVKAQPEHGWYWDWPKQNPYDSTKYDHKFHIVNYDLEDEIRLVDLSFVATAVWYEDLTQITFPSSYPDFTLAPGQGFTANIQTVGSLASGHIYFKYEIWENDMMLSTAWADHVVTNPPQGGDSVPIDVSQFTATGSNVITVILIVSIACTTIFTSIYIMRFRNKEER